MAYQKQRQIRSSNAVRVRRKKKIEIFTDSKTVRRELELSEVREACVSEAMSLR